MTDSWIASIKAITWPGSSASRRVRRWHLAIAIGALGILAFQLYLLLRAQACLSTQQCSVDFHQFYDAALAIRHGADPYVHALMVRGTTQSAYVYPPFFALLLTPFTLLPLPLALTVWNACNLIFLAAAIAALLRAAGARPALVPVALFAAIGSFLGPVRSTLHWGQADLFILCCISTALLARSKARPVLAGLLLGAACATKPTYLALVVWLLWKREFKLATVTALACLAYFFVPFLWLGSQSLHDELSTLQFLSQQYTTTLVNHAPMGVLQRLLTVNPYVRPLITAPWLVTVLWLAVVGVVLVLTVALTSPKPLRADAPSLLEAGLAVVAVFLASPMTEEGHLTVLVLPLIALYVWLGEVSWRPRRVRMIALGTGVLLLVLLTPLHSAEAALWNRTAAAHWPLKDVFMLLAAVYLYVLIAMFVLLLNALGVAQGRSVRGAVREVVSGAPALLGQWIHDAQAAWTGQRVPSGWPFREEPVGAQQPAGKSERAGSSVH